MKFILIACDIETSHIDENNETCPLSGILITQIEYI